MSLKNPCRSFSSLFAHNFGTTHGNGWIVKSKVVDQVNRIATNMVRLLKSYAGVFVKFCVIGMVTAGIQLAVFKLVLMLNVNYQVSSFCGLFVSTTLAYVGNRLWTFRSSNQFIRELFHFYLSRAVTVPLNALILFMLVTLLNWEKTIAQVIAIGVIMLVNFAVGQKIVFKQRFQRDANNVPR